MTASKSEGELLRELRTQLQETQATDFETNRASMIALLDQIRSLNFDRHFGTGIGATLRAMEDAFVEAIEQTLHEKDIVITDGTVAREAIEQLFHEKPIILNGPVPQQEKDRIFDLRRKEELERIERRLNELGKEVYPLHAGAVLYLFSALQYRACSVIRVLLALAKTTDPAKLKEQFPWLPHSLIRAKENALKAEKLKSGYTMTKKGKFAVRAAWIEAGFHQRRARRGELDEFCRRMAKEHDCEANTIKNNWIDEWRKAFKAE